MVDKLRFVGMLMNLTDLCEVFTDGDWIESKDQSKDGIRLIQTGNIGIGQFIEKDDKAKYISIETFERLKCTEVFEGDILVSRLPDPIGRACIVPNKTERMITAVDCTICRPKADIIDREYLCYFMQSKTYYERLFNNVTGTTRKRISRKNLGNVEIYVPSKEEQKIIVKKLNLLTKIISNRTKELSYLDNLIKARFVEMFGDPVHNSLNQPVLPMTDVCEIIDGDRGKNYPKQDEFFDDEYCLFLNAKNVTKKGFDFSESMFITKEKDEQLRKGKLKRGDVVLTTRGTLGNIAFYTEDIPFENVRINSGMVILRLNKDLIDETFFIEQFRMQVDNIKTSVASGSAQPQLPISTMNKILVLMPDLKLQKQFSRFITQIDKSKVVVPSKIKNAIFVIMLSVSFGQITSI